MVIVPNSNFKEHPQRILDVFLENITHDKKKYLENTHMVLDMALRPLKNVRILISHQIIFVCV